MDQFMGSTPSLEESGHQRHHPLTETAFGIVGAVLMTVDITGDIARLAGLILFIMANTVSAAKRARQTVRRTLANQRALGRVKSQLKKVRGLIREGNKAAALTEYRKLASALDKAVKTGRVHRNAAARHKSAFNRRIAALA